MAVLDFASVSYRVERGADGGIRWVARRGGRDVVFDSEPEAGPMRRLASRLLGWLVPEDWL